MAITNADYGTIRQFDGRDLDRILEIASASLSEYYSEALIMDLYDEWPQAFLVYTMGREIQGFIIGSRFSPTEARVLILAVDQQFRNMGIGGALMQAFLALCSRNNFMSVKLEVRTDNDNAINFYRKLGFVVTSRLKAYYSDSSDAYTMWKIL